MSKSKKLFGTDGVRGVANTEPMTSETALRLGRAMAHVFRRSPRRHKVLIGKDTRVSGYMLETAMSSGVCSMGVDVLLVGPMPTPGIAFLTRSLRADAGVVISASENVVISATSRCSTGGWYTMSVQSASESGVLAGQRQRPGSSPIRSAVGLASCSAAPPVAPDRITSVITVNGTKTTARGPDLVTASFAVAVVSRAGSVQQAVSIPSEPCSRQA